ncbi:MAG: glycosyltransferase family 2 protein [Candidatus Peribacteraceae bacterium]|nr:glycosyltransferase family 2 protein [Candidatus Peribacteraceae bacterium]
MENMPLVSALVLNYKNPQYTVNCVQNLLRQTIADRMEILVVDNHSSDDSIGVLRNRLGKAENVRIIETPGNLGFGAGNNRGARYARGKYLLIINPDTEPEPKALEQLVHMLEADETIGMIAPKLEFADRSMRDSFRRFPSVTDFIIKRTPLRHLLHERLNRYLRRSVQPTEVCDVEWVVGACMLMRRSLYESLEGFDERYFLFLEDTDLCRRCWEAGFRVVFSPQTVAADRKQRLSGEGFLPILLKKTGRIHAVSAMKYFWKWRGQALPDTSRIRLPE